MLDTRYNNYQLESEETSFIKFLANDEEHRPL